MARKWVRGIATVAERNKIPPKIDKYYARRKQWGELEYADKWDDIPSSEKHRLSAPPHVIEEMDVVMIRRMPCENCSNVGGRYNEHYVLYTRTTPIKNKWIEIAQIELQSQQLELRKLEIGLSLRTVELEDKKSLWN